MRKILFVILSVVILLAGLPAYLMFAGPDRNERLTASGHGAPRFTLNEAILTALRQNPTIQIARQEIERTKGLYIQMRAAALPQIVSTGQFQDTDPHLLVNHGAPVNVNPTPGATPIIELGSVQATA